MKRTLLAFALAQALDTATTCTGLQRGFDELNPIFRGASCRRVVAIKSGLMAVYMPVAWKQSKRHPKTWKAVTLGLTIGTTAAGIWNLVQLSK